MAKEGEGVRAGAHISLSLSSLARGSEAKAVTAAAGTSAAAAASARKAGKEIEGRRHFPAHVPSGKQSAAAVSGRGSELRKKRAHDAREQKLLLLTDRRTHMN